MKWILINDEDQLHNIVEKSNSIPQIIFKHSTKCSISSIAKARLEREYAPVNADFYYLDLIAYRNISNKIASMFLVEHQSPQILIIKNGQCIFDESHSSITMDTIIEHL